MTKFRLGRRTLLKGALAGGTVGMGLPLLESMVDEVTAKPAAPPQRFGKWFWGIGPGGGKNFWVPKETGADWELTPALASLEAVKEYVTVASGMDFKFKGRAHSVSRAAVLANSYDKDTINVTPGDAPFGGAKVPSIDQVVAQAWAGQTRLDSLVVRISRMGEGPHAGTTSWAAPRQILTPTEEPQALFDRLFSTGDSGPMENPVDSEKLAALRKSVLDATLDNANTLMQRISTVDRQRLEAHAEGVRTLERQLAMDPSNDACAGPGERPPLDQLTPDGGEDLETRNRLMTDVIALGLACDQSRVFSVEFTSNQASTRFFQVGAKDGQHKISHTPNPIITDISLFIMKQFGYFMEKLQSTPDGEGNLLDTACVYHASEYIDGRQHKMDSGDSPILVCGKLGGVLRSGFHFRGQNQDNAGKVLLTMVRALGIEMDSIGTNPGTATEIIPELMA